jgi:alcohol dehydrogenase class IV
VVYLWWFSCPKIVFGKGALKVLETLEGNKAMIITDKTLLELGIVDKAKAYLEKTGMIVKVFAEIEPEPRIETVLKVAKVVQEFSPDWIIGLGGGSCIDAAKAAWALYERPDLTIEDLNPFNSLGLGRKARLAAIPTTSGTGSEATCFIVVHDEKTREKIALGNSEILPHLAIVDPDLPASMPPKLTASTGLDVLCHAVEAYTCTWSNPFTDALALSAIKIVFDYLVRSYKEGDYESREKLHIAATLAGMAINNAETSLGHALGHAIGGLFKIPHGIAVGILLPYCLQYECKKSPERCANIARAIGIETTSKVEAAKKLVVAIKDLLKQLGVPSSFRELGIDENLFQSELTEIAKRAASDDSTLACLRIPTLDEYRKISLCAYYGRDVDF